jgi:hypothetical protein
MGWCFSPNWRDRAEMLTYLRRPERYGDKTLIRSVAVGNNHWYLVRNPSGEVWIGLDLMKGGTRREPGWGYKDLDETCGPCEVNCPLSFLEQASPTDHRYAAPWRESVREHHAKKTKRPKPTEGLNILYGGTKYTLVRPAGPRKGWYVRAEGGGQYRMSAHQLAQSQELV